MSNAPAAGAVRRAVIDIGTNSVKLLVGDVQEGLITPVLEDSKQTRLGAGLYTEHCLQPDAIAKTTRAVANYVAEARKQGVESVLIIATSATRDARNSKDLLHAINQIAGLKVRILTGNEEAEWVFGGVMTDAQFATQPVFIVDVGGGSSEIILGENGQKYWSGSFNIGAVRLLEQLKLSDPPGLAALQSCRELLRKYFADEAAPKIGQAIHKSRKKAQLIGVGGTATILARVEKQIDTFDRERIESARVSLKRLHSDLESLWQKPLSERQTIVGIPPKRADVILTGMTIYETIMTQFGFEDVRVSTRGLRYYALLQDH
jgi:exopolyphosphatase / guanosine-5'-triphosphate,3'-diphosphate pyrophosphatase